MRAMVFTGGRLRTGLARALAAIVVAMAWAVPDVVANDCSTLVRQAQEQNKRPSDHVGGLIAQSDQRTGDVNQSFGLRMCRTRLMFIEWRHAQQNRPEAANPETDRETLRDILGVLEYWQAHQALGDLEAEQGDHAEAARRYSLALHVLDDRNLTPEDVAEGDVERLFRKAEQARLLASRHVELPKARGDGSGANLAAGAVRGYEVRDVALPIRFDFNGDALTDLGRRSADDLFDLLSKERPHVVRLVGHTDRVGGDAYNCELSWRRVRAVRDYLVSRGLPTPPGGYELVGMGKVQPFRFTGPAPADQNLVDQANRRVQYLRSPLSQPSPCPSPSS
jgi:outer membrane protein OmpA-like peptidoglycan-associated protein